MDLKKISLIEFEPEAFVDCINDFTVDTSGLPPDQRADIQCDIAGPDGSPVDCFVNKMGPDGPYQVNITYKIYTIYTSHLHLQTIVNVFPTFYHY